MAYIRVARKVLQTLAANAANFTKQFANYAAQYNITVNCVHPGYTATERLHRSLNVKQKRVTVVLTT